AVSALLLPLELGVLVRDGPVPVVLVAQRGSCLDVAILPCARAGDDQPGGVITRRLPRGRELAGRTRCLRRGCPEQQPHRDENRPAARHEHGSTPSCPHRRPLLVVFEFTARPRGPEPPAEGLASASPTTNEASPQTDETSRPVEVKRQLDHTVGGQ